MQFSQHNLPNNLLLHKIHKDPPPWEQGDNTCYVKGVVRKKKIQKSNNYVLIIEAIDIMWAKNGLSWSGDKDKLIVGEIFEYSISFFNIEKE